MTALAADRDTKRRHGTEFSLPVAAGAKIYAGAMVAIITSSTSVGYAKQGVTATTLRGVGVCQETIDNTSGADGAVNVNVRRGVFRFANSPAGDLIALKDIGSTCYIVDDQTVALTNGTNTRSVAGTIRDVEAAGVWVEF